MASVRFSKRASVWKATGGLDAFELSVVIECVITADDRDVAGAAVSCYTIGITIFARDGRGERRLGRLKSRSRCSGVDWTSWRGVCCPALRTVLHNKLDQEDWHYLRNVSMGLVP